MPIELKLRKASVYSPCGALQMVYDYRCPRCHNIVMFFESDRSPIICKCGCVQADMKGLHKYIRDRIDWHYHYMIKR